MFGCQGPSRLIYEIQYSLDNATNTAAARCGFLVGDERDVLYIMDKYI